MLCKKMVSSKGTVHPCGQCLFCRINSKREWISRLLLENACHLNSQFWTLTYDEENLPTRIAPGRPVLGSGYKDVRGFERSVALLPVASQAGTLLKHDLQNFFKRYRKRHESLFRYFAVGEYGEKLGRPHYHVLAFGACIEKDELQELWSRGHVHIGDVTSASINYCVEYAVKKQSKDIDLVNLRRQPEFAVMSRNPGIGSYALGSIREAIFKTPPLPSGEYLIPDEYMVSGRKYPMSRYLRSQLEDEGFISSSKAFAAGWRDTEQMCALLARSTVAKAAADDLLFLFGEHKMDEIEYRNQLRSQKILNAEARQKLFGVKHEAL